MKLDKLSTLNRREKIWLALAAFFVFSVLVDRVAAQYVVRQFRDMENTIQSERDRVIGSLRMLKSGRTIAREYEAFRKNLAESPANASGVDRMKGEVDELAAEAGISILSMKQREPRAGSSWVEYLVELERFEAGTKELLSFLHRLACSRNFLRVERLTLTAQKDPATIGGSMVISKLTFASETVPSAAPNPEKR